MTAPAPATTPGPGPGLTDGRLLARNALGNLASQAAPMAVAVLTLPLLVRGLGTDRFGVLTLAWVLLGYCSLFDLGLGRALTKLVAEALGRDRGREVPALVGTALALMLLLGVAGAAALALLTPWLVDSALKIPAPIRRESRVAFYMMAAALPFLIGTAGLRGVLESYQRLARANLVRTGVALALQLGPLLVLAGTSDLGVVVGVVAALRVASFFLHLRICLDAVPGLRAGCAPRLGLIRPLLGFGGWMTVANVINPIMVQMDRFLIGALASAAAVAYYTTPYELVTKYWFLSNAVLGVIFPALATSFARDRAETARLFGRGLKYVFLILAALTVLTVVLAPEILRLWLGAAFAARSAGVLRCLAVGVLLNGLAQVPSALLQAVGRPDLVAKLHLIELPIYLALAWPLIREGGNEGAALAWTARTALDLVLFGAAAWLILPGGAAAVRRLAPALALALAACGVGALIPDLAARLVFLAAVALAASAVVWCRALTRDERSWLLGRFAPTGRGPAAGADGADDLGMGLTSP